MQLIYRATLVGTEFAPGEESLEVDLFKWDRIPWDELAFPSVHWALNQFQEVKDKPVFSPFTNPVPAHEL